MSDEIGYATIRELGRALPRAPALAGRGHAGHAGADREARSGPERVRDADRRPRPGRRPRGRGIPAPRRRSSAARHPHRAQGHLLHARHPHHRRLGAAGRLGARHGRHLRAALAGGRDDHARQADHPRVRVRAPVPRPPLPAGAQPVEPRPRPGRLEQRLGRRAGGRARAWRDGLRHGRLDPGPGSVLRHRRSQADVRPLQPGRRADAVVDARPHGADGADGGGLRLPVAGRWPATTRPIRRRAGAPVDDYLAPHRTRRPRPPDRRPAQRTSSRASIPRSSARSRRRWRPCGSSASRCATCASRACTRRPPSC